MNVPLEQSDKAQHDVAIAAWVLAPTSQLEPGQTAIWFLAIPGATYRGLSSFDRQVPGFSPDTFRIARFLARHGIGRVVIDTLGTDASAAEITRDLINSFVTADVNAQVLFQIRQHLVAGKLGTSAD